MRDHALEMARMGWRVHPVHGVTPEGLCTCGSGVTCRSSGKHPVLTDWVREASSDPEVICSWDWAGRNLGVVPSGFCILDFDGVEGARLLERMSAVLPPLLDETPIAQTGSGGFHVFVAGEAKTRTKILPGLDVRGIGGQAVLPPSRHFSGAVYTWMNPPKGPIPEAPEWLAVAQGNIPDALQPVDVVTAEDLLKFARGNLLEPVRRAMGGEPFAEPGNRDTVLSSITGFIARRWPYSVPSQIAELFHPCLASMAQWPGAPTEVAIISKLQRFQALQREQLTRRPKIIITTDIEDMVCQAVEATTKRALEIGCYSRGGLLTRVRPQEHLPSGVLRGELPHTFEPLVAANLTAYLTTVAYWVRKQKDGEKPALPPAQVIARIDRRGEWPGVPHAERIVEGAFLRPDGSIHPGGTYDEVTGTVSVGHPDHTPPVSVDEALTQLARAVCDFPFAGPEHFSAWLASVLTGVGQAVFRGPSPLFLIDANVRGAGKTLLAELSILIVSGRSASRAGLGQDNTEDRKQITALGMSGASCVLIDNVVGLFGTPKLCEALSLHDSGWSDRILGESRTWSGPLKPTWWATGNNIRLRPDIARRTCYIRLDSPLEKPELRKGFANPSLMAWVGEHRVELYRAAMSLLHHYLQAGAPQQDLPAWGTYESWGQLVRGCLVWSGLADPAEAREGLGVADEDGELAALLLRGLSELEEHPFTPTGICAVLYGPSQTIADMARFATLREALDAGCVQKQLTPTPQSVGRLLARFRERVVGGLRLRKLSRPGSWWEVTSEAP